MPTPELLHGVIAIFGLDMEAKLLAQNESAGVADSAWIRFDFRTRASHVELVRTQYYCPISRKLNESVRGKSSYKSSSNGSFQWTPGVVGLCVVLLKAKLAEDSDFDSDWFRIAGLSSDDSKLAVSLDYAISKGPNWLLDMFGVDKQGLSFSRRLFVRLNTERRRPGPLVIAVNGAFLSYSNIELRLNDREVKERPELFSLLRQIVPKAGSFNSVVTLPTAPSVDNSLKIRLEPIASLVSAHLYRAYVKGSETEQWSCGDAVLGLIRHESYREAIAKEADKLIDFLKPREDGSYPSPETKVGVPIVAATCMLALAELSLLERISDKLVRKARQYLDTSLNSLLSTQSDEGWWSIVSEPRSILNNQCNGRVWDTAYIYLALSHLDRLSSLTQQGRACALRAHNWLLCQYVREEGWSNRPDNRAHKSEALTSFVHFVFAYSKLKPIEKTIWDISHAAKHVEGLTSLFRWNVALENRDYRLRDVEVQSLPHPNHIVQLAFILGLLGIFKDLSHDSVQVIERFLSSNWSSLMKGVYLSTSVFPYSQLLQGVYLFNKENEQ